MTVSKLLPVDDALCRSHRSIGDKRSRADHPSWSAFDAAVKDIRLYNFMQQVVLVPESQGGRKICVQ